MSIYDFIRKCATFYFWAHALTPFLFIFPFFFNLRPVSSDQTDFSTEYNKIDLRN